MEKIYTKEQLKEIYMNIHKVIHSDQKNITIDGQIIPVEKSKSNGCRK